MRQITVREIYKAYGDTSVFSGFSAVFQAGGVYALMGASGSGKTTLLRLLARLEQPDRGQIDGIEPGDASFMFQEDRLLEYLDATSNVLFTSPKADRRMIAEKLCELGIEEQDHHRPVSAFSGGMKRRVALLRTLVSDKQVLLLDEPFKGLDEMTAQNAIHVLLAMRGRKTVIISTHSREEAQLCGAAVVLIPSPDPGSARFTSVQEKENTLY